MNIVSQTQSWNWSYVHQLSYHKSFVNSMKSLCFMIFSVRSPFSNGYWRFKALKPIICPSFSQEKCHCSASFRAIFAEFPRRGAVVVSCPATAWEPGTAWGCIPFGKWLIYPLDDMGMVQYLLIPFLMGWTSIYQLFWGSPGVQGFDTLPYGITYTKWGTTFHDSI